MSRDVERLLEAHLRRHARKLHHIACGLGRRRDADDIIQILYARWWRRIQQDPSWVPPEHGALLFVSVKRVVMDEVAKEQRLRRRQEHGRHLAPAATQSAEESLQALERLRWILSHLPAPLAEALTASLSSGGGNDAEIARELNITHSAYTARLFKARRAAERLAQYYDVLSPDQASLMAAVSYSGKTRAQIAQELCLVVDELATLCQDALATLEHNQQVASS